MKKSELKQLIREEIQHTLNERHAFSKDKKGFEAEESNLDMVKRSLNVIDKAVDMVIKNPTGDVIELVNIIQTHSKIIRGNI
jgi:hypothetical protein